MLATHQLRDGEPAARARRAAARRARPVPHDAVLVPGRPVHPRRRRRRRAVVAGQRAPGAHRRPARVPDRAGSRSPTREWQRFIDAGGYDEPRWWSDARLGAPGRGATSSGRCSGRADGSRRRFGHRRGHPGRTSRSSTSASSRPRPTRPGPARGCPPSRSGRRPAPGTRRRAAGAAGRGATPSRPPRWPTSAATALRPAPVGAYPAGASAYGVEQLIGDVWEWTSSDFEPWPGFEPMLYAALQRAVLRRRLPGAARRLVGGRRRRRSGRRSATGTCRSGGRSSAASGWPGTRCMCRHLAWLGRAAHARRARARARRTACCAQSYAPAPAGARPDQRRRLGRRASTPQAGAEPARWRSARPLWSDASFASVAPVLSLGLRARGRPLGHRRACRSTRAPRRRSPTAAGCSRTTAGSTGRSCRSHAEAESVCDSALLAAHVFAARPGRASASSSSSVARPRPRRPAEPAAHRRRSACSATTWGDTLCYLVEPRTACVVASEPYDDDPRWIDVPDRHLRRGDARPASP